MTVEKKLNVRLDQQIVLWLQKQEKQRQAEAADELRPVAMKVALDSKQPETGTL